MSLLYSAHVLSFFSDWFIPEKPYLPGMQVPLFAMYWWILVLFPAVFVHELGHAAVYLLFSDTRVAIQFGEGRHWAFALGRLRVRGNLRPFPSAFAGPEHAGVEALMSPPLMRLVSATGLAAETFCLAMTWVLTPGSLAYAWFGLTYLFIMAITLINLIPIPLGGGTSDGLKIIAWAFTWATSHEQRPATVAPTSGGVVNTAAE